MATASPLFLTEPEIRRGIELLFFGYGQLTRAIDAALDEHGIGRAHQRALYFIARRPNLSVGELLGLLAITKQSLGRVLTDLIKRGLVESRPGDRDRRQRLLRLTAEGSTIEARLFATLNARMADAYSRAGQEAVGGFWGVLEGLVPAHDRGKIGR
jgi:DNA-binding MarR family transcriptional regulator